MPETAKTQDILLVEDDARTADTVALYLRHGGYRVSVEHDGQKGLDRALAGGFDLLILDWMLPGVDGPEICKQVRAQSDVLILMLTARVAEHERLEGFDVGADDYVAKPFSPREVLARVNAMMRRSRNDTKDYPLLRVGSVTINEEQHRVDVRGERVELTPAEYAILTRLVKARGKVFSRESLLSDCAPDALSRTVDVHIKNLRFKIEEDRGNPRLLHTVFGTGYKFEDVDE